MDSRRRPQQASSQDTPERERGCARVQGLVGEVVTLDVAWGAGEVVRQPVFRRIIQSVTRLASTAVLPSGRSRPPRPYQIRCRRPPHRPMSPLRLSQRTSPGGSDLAGLMADLVVACFSACLSIASQTSPGSSIVLRPPPTKLHVPFCFAGQAVLHIVDQWIWSRMQSSIAQQDLHYRSTSLS